MKSSTICWFLALALTLTLAGVARLASAQVMTGPTPVVTPTNVLNGFVQSDGKNANGVAERTEKGANGSENGAKGK